jgi:hypothetical protein
VLVALLVTPVAAVAGAMAYDRAALGSGRPAQAAQLAPFHEDTPPPGVDVKRRLTTEELYAKARMKRPGRGKIMAQDGAPSTAAAPSGTPVIPRLTQHVEPSCTGTGSDGNRVQVVYARAEGLPDRLAEVDALIRGEVATVDDVFAVSSDATAGGRRVRWVSDSSCRVVVQRVSLPQGSLGTSLDATFDALRAAGLTAPNRKYLVFSEGASICGVGEMYPDTSPDENSNDNPELPGGESLPGMLTRIDQGCWSNPTYHSVAAHELVHTLGGVLDSAPHPSAAGHCTDESDLMCYDDDGAGPVVMRQVCPLDQEMLLDCQKDDYFHTSPSAGSFLALNWNTADSSFLDVVAPLGLPAREPTALAVRVSGASPATVTGTLTRSGGSPVAGAQITLRTRPYGSSTWTIRAGLTTNSSGSVSYAVTPSSPQYVELAYAGDSARAAATSPTVLVRVPTTTSTTAAAGSTTTLTGTVLNPVTRRGLAGLPVTLRVRWAGSTTWSTVTTALRTDVSGRAVYRYPTSRPGTFAFSHPGSTTTLSSGSSGALVRVPTKLTMTVKAGRPNLLTGRLTSWSGTAMRSATVTLQYRYAGTSTWRAGTTYRTSSTGYVSVRLQPKRAVYYRWVYGGTSSTHLASTSAAGYVRY